MIDNWWKAKLEKYKMAIAKSVPKNISANDISLIGLVFGLVGCLANVYNCRFTTFICVLLSCITDAVDGKS
jgi:phosphatidylglycerophosphate synthase